MQRLSSVLTKLARADEPFSPQVTSHNVCQAAWASHNVESDHVRKHIDIIQETTLVVFQQIDALLSLWVRRRRVGTRVLVIG